MTGATRIPNHEAARELYHAGYTHALDDVITALNGIRFSDPFCTITPAMVVNKMRERQAGVLASVAIAKATGNAS